MKKSLFIMALGAIALTSCSQDEVLEVKKDAITFAVATENASRASADDAVLDMNSLASFQVWAWADTDGDDATPVQLYINDETATKDGSVFKLANGYYWPYGTVDFYCVASKSNVDIDANGKMTGNYAVTSNHDDDLLYSVLIGQAKTSNAAPAELNFRHALSMVKFKVASSGLYGLEATVSNIKLVNAAMQGVYTLPNASTSVNLEKPELDDYDAVNNSANVANRGTWTPVANASDLGVESTYYNWAIPNLTADATNGTDAVSVDESDTFFVLPQTITPADPADWTGQYFLVECKVWKNEVLLHQGEVAVPATVSFAEGYKYIYTLNFGKGAGYKPGTDDPTLFPIEFSVDVDKFQVGTAGEVPVATN